MDVRTAQATIEDLLAATSDTLVLVVPPDATAWQLPKPLKALLEEAVVQQDLTLKPGKTLYLHRPAGFKPQRLVVAVAADASAKAFKAAVSAALGPVRGSGAKSVTLAWAGRDALGADHAEQAVRALDDALYVYRHTKPSAPPASKLVRVTLAVNEAAGGSARTAATNKAALVAVREGVRRGQAIAAGVGLARECANRPGNHCTPTYLASEARALARGHGLKVEVLERAALEKLGMGAFLAVAKGSDEPPKFIVLQYHGAGKKDAPLVLVGKGITFDSGGISIKPAGEMDEMKFDMGGAASVLGTFRAVAELQPKINLIGLIPTCENMPNGGAMKPGDVITSLAGKTIEVLNTDAEGRLILCDALAYAERFKPAAVVDIATLTGACVIALGHHHSGLFSTDDALAQGLLNAGQAALDTAWRMPMDDEYDKALDSNFADIANVGPRYGGSITAAMFLKRFTSAYRWAHLDIAGTAWRSGAAKGATGRPVALLTHFVLAQAAAAA
ncbi:MAG: leucyl aminopeptidase [Burkholderiales bacterium]